MNLDSALKTFIVEGRELLHDMEQALLRVAAEDDPSESINAIFRAAHTVKGSAGLFGLDGLVAFTHAVESVLDDVRAGATTLDARLIELLLASADHIGVLIDAAEAGLAALPAEQARCGDALRARLQERHRGTDIAAPARASAVEASDFSPAPDEARADHWHLSIRFGRSVLRNGMDPLAFIRFLSTQGRIEHIVVLHEAVPALDALDPEACHLGFEIGFRSNTDQTAIERVFEFVIDDCELRIVAPGSPVEAFVDLVEQRPHEAARLAEILVQCGSVQQPALQAALRARRDGVRPAADTPGPGREEQLGTSTGSAAQPQRARQEAAKPTEGPLVRVDAAKLDRLIDLVGELITRAAAAKVLARRTNSIELQECNCTLSDLVEDVRDSALQLRMVKIGATFARFKRVVHDMASELGKDIELRIAGDATELDKTVAEKIGDPLMHLVRNAIDHGIDAPAARAALGKPARGTVTLNAHHDSDSIVIEVGDDGRGLDRERILAKGIERGLVEAGRNLSDAEVYALIFEPGFSTAEQVTKLSGRGVGMDVVKRNISALRGSVGIDSHAGHGTTVTLRLPLTLSIIKGLHVNVGPTVFVIPLEMVDECVEHSAAGGHGYADLRGEVLPCLHLRDMFDVPGTPPRHQNVVVAQHAGHKFGLVVDALLGEAQTVIKPLSKMFADVNGISGSSILGSGDVALIVDVPMLFRQAQHASMGAAHAQAAAASPARSEETRRSPPGPTSPAVLQA